MIDIANIEAESRLLGCLMLASADQARPVAECLTQQDFSVPLHRAVFAAICALIEQGRPAEVGLVLGELRRTGDLRSDDLDPGPARRLLDMTANVITWRSATFYAKDVLEASLRRRVVEAADRLHQVAPCDSLETVIAVTNAEFSAVAQALGRQISLGASC